MKIFRRHNKITKSTEEENIIDDSRAKLRESPFQGPELFQRMIKIGSSEGMKNQKKYYP